MSVSQCTPLSSLKTTMLAMQTKHRIWKRMAQNCSLLGEYVSNATSLNITHRPSMVWLDGYEDSASMGLSLMVTNMNST